MSAHATRRRPAPIRAGVPCLVEAINLDGWPTIRVTQAGILVGYFATIAAAVSAGVDLSTALTERPTA